MVIKLITQSSQIIKRQICMISVSPSRKHCECIDVSRKKVCQICRSLIHPLITIGPSPVCIYDSSMTGRTIWKRRMQTSSPRRPVQYISYTCYADQISTKLETNQPTPWLYRPVNMENSPSPTFRHCVRWQNNNILCTKALN